jgi:cation diffusion facilitator family transporter
MERSERFGRADRIISVGFWVNALLMVMKLLAGYFGGSEAVFADGMESACDFIALLSTMIALKIGRKPYDANHPYGHGRAESLSAIMVSLVIFGTGGWILFNSVTTVIKGVYSSPQMVAVIAAFLTIIIKEWLYRFSMKTGSSLQSPALLAVAKDHRKDAITSIATLVGVTAAFFGFRIMDPIAAGLTSVFIFHIGWETFRGAAHDLMDGQPEEELLTAIVALAEGVAGVEHVHEIKGRRSGQYLIIDLKLEMDPDMTVKESHDIATAVKKVIFDHNANIGDVMIHINPHEEEHEDLIRL